MHGRRRRELPRPGACRCPAQGQPERSPALRSSRSARRAVRGGHQGEPPGSFERARRAGISRRCEAARTDQVVRAGLPHANGRARGPAIRRRGYLDPTALRTGPRRHETVRPATPGGSATGRAGSPLHPGVPRRGCRRGLGRPHRPPCQPRDALHQVDRPIAGLLVDLKRRGLLDDTIVVWATEFGRTPCAQGPDGRDHHNYGFSVWLAGGGIQGGIVHGATDELGFHAVEHRHYVTDIHATILQLLGLDSRRLEIPGRKRLEVEHGRPIRQILA